jgi:hypothetical protein
MPPNILTSVTALTPASADRTDAANSWSGGAERARDRDEVLAIDPR